MKGESREERS